MSMTDEEQEVVNKMTEMLMEHEIRMLTCTFFMSEDGATGTHYPEKCYRCLNLKGTPLQEV